MASDLSLAWPPAEAVFDGSLIMINKAENRTQSDYSSDQSKMTKDIFKRPCHLTHKNQLLLYCRKAVFLLHVAVETFWQ